MKKRLKDTMGMTKYFELTDYETSKYQNSCNVAEAVLKKRSWFSKPPVSLLEVLRF